MSRPDDEARCDLNPDAGARRFARGQHSPSNPALEWLVDAYWTVAWDLPADEPYLHESLPDPAIHLVLQAGQSRLAGVTTGRFSYPLTGAGRIFGLRFRPAAFRALIDLDAAEVTDLMVPVVPLLGPDAAELEAAVLATDPADDGAAIALVEAFLLARRPVPTDDGALAGRIVEEIIADRDIHRADQLTTRFGLSARTLQRLFARFIGVSPKWVIRRYRLLEAADRLIAGPVDDWAGLAADLGYYDQAHFINDFTTVVGRPPGAHARLVKGAPV